jgi:hypothetical protein
MNGKKIQQISVLLDVKNEAPYMEDFCPPIPM